jgi:dolichol-phosphate mannosyltransferase
MALDSLISFSDLPLRFMVVFGTIIAVAGFLSILLIIFEKLFFHEFQAGWPSTIAIIVFLGGIQILVTGLASLYIGRILKEVQNRPLYIVREKYNFP